MPPYYGSVFRQPVFKFGDTIMPNGVDFSINVQGTDNSVSVKRIYTMGSASVNVAPYVRGKFLIKPVHGGGLGITTAPERVVRCNISTTGLTTATVPLTCGTEDPTLRSILSAAPATVVIRPGESDEIAIVTGESYAVKPFVEFTHGGQKVTYEGLSQITTSDMVLTLVGMAKMDQLFLKMTGVSPGEFDKFTVSIRIRNNADGTETYVRRNYKVDRNSFGGRRLAWINRYGTVDYYTFPEVRETKFGGSRTRIETPEGYRTIATDTGRTETLDSGPCDDRTAEWLSEIFSSPTVWKIVDGVCEQVEASGGTVECAPENPAKVTVKIESAERTPSRKLW